MEDEEESMSMSMTTTMMENALLAIISRADDQVQETVLLLERLLHLSRSPSHRTLLASLDAVPRLLSLLRLRLSATPSTPFTLLLLKLLRNLCAGEPSNQFAFLHNDGFRSLSLLFSLSLESDPVCIPPDVQSLVRFSLQLVGNACGGGEAHKEAAWSTFFPHWFCCLASIGTDDQIMEPLCMILYSCCHGFQHRLAELCCGEGAMLVSACLTAIARNGDASGDLYTGSWDWISLLLSELCLQQPLLPHLFINLARSNANPSSFTTQYTSQLAETTFCTEHVTLLTYLVELLRDMPNDNESDAFSVSDTGLLPLPSASVQFLKDAMEVTSRRLTLEISDELQPRNLHVIDILQNVLEIFKLLCASEYGFRSSMIAELLSSGFFKLCLELLRDLGPPDLIAKSIKKHGEVESTAKEGILLQSPYQGFRRDIVAILANASYQNRAVQDEIRNLGGLTIILQQCVVDDHNPFLREWGFWAVRNLLQDNLDNIKEIAELQLKGSVTPDELQQNGYKVEVDPVIGRPKLVNLSSHEQAQN